MDSTTPNDSSHSSQTETVTATTQLAEVEWAWSNEAAAVPVHSFTVLPQPEVTIESRTASLDRWGFVVEPDDPHEDPLLTQLVTHYTSPYILDCLRPTQLGDAHRSAVAKYVDAYDRYTSSRARASLRAETDRLSLHKARRTLMGGVVRALNADTGVLGEYVRIAYLRRTNEVIAVTVSFADDPLTQGQSTHTSRALQS